MYEVVQHNNLTTSESQNTQQVINISLSVLPALIQSVQSMSLSVTPAQTAAWRKQIFEQLSERTKREIDNFRHFEQAIEQVQAGQKHLFYA